MNRQVAKLHALLFAQPGGVSLQDVMEFCQTGQQATLALLARLEQWLKGSGVSLFEHKGVYALVVDQEVSAAIEEFSPSQKLDLTQPMLEVLTIVAHSQPCTKQSIDEIRGVNSEQTIRNLLQLGLIEESVDPADPLALTQLITTRDFLMHEIGRASCRERV